MEWRRSDLTCLVPPKNAHTQTEISLCTYIGQSESARETGRLFCMCTGDLQPSVHVRKKNVSCTKAHLADSIVCACTSGLRPLVHMHNLATHNLDLCVWTGRATTTQIMSMQKLHLAGVAPSISTCVVGIGRSEYFELLCHRMDWQALGGTTMPYSAFTDANFQVEDTCLFDIQA